MEPDVAEERLHAHALLDILPAGKLSSCSQPAGTSVRRLATPVRLVPDFSHPPNQLPENRASQSRRHQVRTNEKGNAQEHREERHHKNNQKQGNSISDSLPN